MQSVPNRVPCVTGPRHPGAAMQACICRAGLPWVTLASSSDVSAWRSLTKRLLYKRAWTAYGPGCREWARWPRKHCEIGCKLGICLFISWEGTCAKSDYLAPRGQQLVYEWKLAVQSVSFSLGWVSSQFAFKVSWLQKPPSTQFVHKHVLSLGI